MEPHGFLEYWKAASKQPWRLKQFWKRMRYKVKFSSWGIVRHCGESYLSALITSLPCLRHEKSTPLSNSANDLQVKRKKKPLVFKRSYLETWRSLAYAQEQFIDRHRRTISNCDGFVFNISGIRMSFFGAPTRTWTAGVFKKCKWFQGFLSHPIIARLKTSILSVLTVRVNIICQEYEMKTEQCGLTQGTKKNGNCSEIC
jgi:hypothetical protein